MRKHTIIQAVLTAVVVIVAVASTLSQASLYGEVSLLKHELDNVRDELASANERLETNAQDLESRITGQVVQVQESQDTLIADVQEHDAELDQIAQVIDSGTILERVIPSVVQIDRKGTDGTGFMVDGYIMTNLHVVGRETAVTIIDHTGERYTAHVIATDNERDLAILRPPTFRPESLRFSTGYRTGQRVFVIGNAGGLGLAVTEGVISNAKANDQGLEYIQISAEINHGNSGGPVIDENGNVLGIVRKRLFQYDGVSYAIPAKEAQNILAQG